MPKKPFDADAYYGRAPAKPRTAAECADPAFVKQIMTEIGFGFEPDWYSGGSCAVSRREAFRRLILAIKHRHEDGVPIAPPNPGLFRQLIQIQ